MSLEQSVASVLERQTDRFYGKYRGLVLINVDPQNQGRIKAVVPEVMGIIPTNFCLPCTPYAGTLAGLFTVPMIGTGVREFTDTTQYADMTPAPGTPLQMRLLQRRLLAVNVTPG